MFCRIAGFICLLVSIRASAVPELTYVPDDLMREVRKYSRPVPVLIDWPFSRAGRDYPPDAPEFVAVDMNNLAKMKDAVARETRNRCRLEVISNIPVIVPVTPWDDNLDVTVSLKLDGVSAWEALKSVTRQMSCRLKYGKRMRIYLPIVDPKSSVPKWFTDERVITIDVANVTAREALATIMAQANNRLWIMYMEYRPPEVGAPEDWIGSGLSIQFWQDNEPLQRPLEYPPWEVAKFWQTQSDEAETAAEDCGEAVPLKNGGEHLSGKSTGQLLSRP